MPEHRARARAPSLNRALFDVHDIMIFTKASRMLCRLVKIFDSISYFFRNIIVTVVIFGFIALVEHCKLVLQY